MRISLNLVAPIPVGHRVTVYRLDRKKETLFGETNWYAAPEATIVCDDITKVVYCGQAVGGKGGLRYGAVGLSDTYRIDPEEPPLSGEVTACVVTTIREQDFIDFSTTLEIDPAAVADR